MRIFKLGLAASLVLATTSPSFAATSKPIATLAGLDGKVLVNSGEGYAAGILGNTVEPGDMVFVGEKSGTQLYFDKQKCSVSITAKTLYKVPATAPCKAGEDVAMADDMMIQPTMGGLNSSMIPLAIGGLVVGALVIYAITSHKDKSAS